MIDQLDLLAVLKNNPYHDKQISVLHNEGGELVVTNCAPWAIPGDCQRMDCPMRGLGGLVDPRDGTLFLECYPHGLLADVLRYLQASVLLVEMMGEAEAEDDSTSKNE